MKWFSESFHEQRAHPHSDPVHQNGHQPDKLASSDEMEEQEIEPLMTLAHSLQKAAPLQVDEHFATLLEERLRTSAALRVWASQPTQTSVHTLSAAPPMPKKRKVFSLSAALVCVCVLALCCGGIVLAMRSFQAPQRKTPATVQQVELTDQAAHTLLQTLNRLATPTHAQEYRQALVDLDQQVVACEEEVARVPPSSGWDKAEQEFLELKADARGELYQLLVNLALPERVVTTTELGKLGATVPVVSDAQFTLVPAQNQAVVLVHGSGISAGAHVLIDGLDISGTGIMENGGYEMTIPWAANRPSPQLLGILNGDNTAAQTTTVKVQTGQSTPDPDGDGDGHDGGHDGGQSGGHRGPG